MKLWPKGRVPYIISDGLNSAAREKINEAIEEFHQKTCIKFVPKRKKDKDYVHIVPHHDSCCVMYIVYIYKCIFDTDLPKKQRRYST